MYQRKKHGGRIWTCRAFFSENTLGIYFFFRNIFEIVTSCATYRIAPAQLQTICIYFVRYGTQRLRNVFNVVENVKTLCFYLAAVFSHAKWVDLVQFRSFRYKKHENPSRDHAELSVHFEDHWVLILHHILGTTNEHKQIWWIISTVTRPTTRLYTKK